MLTVKKQLLFIFFLALGVCMEAQTTLDQAVNFEVTDIHGKTINLFRILDRGQAVFINFIHSECGGCQQTTQAMEEAYLYYGCNLHDVFFVEISYDDNDDVLEQWQTDYGLEFPVVGINGGGASVFSAYNIKVCPTKILIKPDHSIPIRAMYPFSIDDYVTLFSSHDIHQHDCKCEPPYDLTAGCVGETVRLKWSSSVVAESYNVYRDGQVIANVSDTCFTDIDAQASIEYCYYVSTICPGGVESEVGEKICVTIPTITCDVPQNLSARFMGETIFLRWDEIERAVSYNVYRNGELFDNVTDPAYPDTEIGEIDEYCYAVSALCENQVGSDLSDTVCVSLPYGIVPHCEKRNLVLYPNPTSDKTSVYVQENSFVRVASVSGQIVYEKRFEGKGLVTLDFSDKTPGVYFLQMICDNCINTCRIIVL